MDIKKRVLIVDDEPRLGKLLGIKLKLAGFDVVSTTSGAGAIELVRTQRFDIILLDVMMPGISGMDVLQTIREFSQVPVIIFTGRDDIFDIARRAGANAHVPKSINPDLLVGKINAVLGESDNKKNS